MSGTIQFPWEIIVGRRPGRAAMLAGMTDAYDEPAGIAARGTVLVAAGRGETSGIYGRFGKRISADGYRVRILPDVAADLGASFAAAEKLLVDDALPGPKVVVGA